MPYVTIVIVLILVPLILIALPLLFLAPLIIILTVRAATPIQATFPSLLPTAMQNDYSTRPTMKSVERAMPELEAAELPPMEDDTVSEIAPRDSKTTQHSSCPLPYPDTR